MMQSFSNYVNRRDLTLLEMAKISKELAIHFDKEDFAYLSHFEPATVNIWMNAIMYRYSSKVLDHPDQEKHDITITTQIDDPNRAGKKQQKEYFFPQVPTFTKHLIEKLQPNYDLSKVEIGRTAARKIATEALAHIEDGSKPVPSIHMNNALKADKKEGRREHDKKIDTGFRHDPTIREPLTLDDQDEKFLRWFDMNMVEDIEGNERPAKTFKVSAFMRRYDGSAKGLINDPQANERYGGTEPGVLFSSLEISGEGGKKWYARGVPVNAKHLRKRLQELQEKGIDFFNIPLQRGSAENWIENGKINLHKGMKSTKEQNKDIGSRRMESINGYIDQQDAHLENPEEVESPGIFDMNFKGFNTEQGWMGILQDEAKLIAKRAIRQIEQFASSVSKIDEEELAQSVWSFLSSEKIASNSDYPSQQWRYNKALSFAREEGKKMLGDKVSFDNKAGLIGKETEKQQALNLDAEEQEKRAALNISPAYFNASLKFLKNLPVAADVEADDVDWNEIAIKWIEELKKWQHENGDTVPNQKIMELLGNEILSNYVPAMAAEPAPLKPKLVPQKKEPIKAPVKPIPVKQEPKKFTQSDLFSMESVNDATMDFLLAIPESSFIPSGDWYEITDRYLSILKEWAEENNKIPSKIIQVVLAKDLLRSIVPA